MLQVDKPTEEGTVASVLLTSGEKKGVSNGREGRTSVGLKLQESYRTQGGEEIWGWPSTQKMGIIVNTH